MHDYLKVVTKVYPDQGAGVTTNLVDFGGATGVVAVQNFGVEVEVLGFGIAVDSAEALVVGTTFGIKLQKYLTPGSSTNAVDLGTITRSADVAAGYVVYNDLSLGDADGEVAEDGSKRNLAPRDEGNNKFIVKQGEQLVWNLTDAADTSGKGQVFVRVVERPLNIADSRYIAVEV